MRQLIEYQLLTMNNQVFMRECLNGNFYNFLIFTISTCGFYPDHSPCDGSVPQYLSVLSVLLECSPIYFYWVCWRWESVASCSNPPGTFPSLHSPPVRRSQLRQRAALVVPSSASTTTPTLAPATHTATRPSPSSVTWPASPSWRTRWRTSVTGERRWWWWRWMPWRACPGCAVEGSTAAGLTNPVL